MYSHFMNDWLGGTWFFLWTCEIGTFCAVVVLIYALAVQHGLLIFVFGTSLLESIAFMIGSAYFVAGSYPEATLATALRGDISLHSDSSHSRVADAENNRYSVSLESLLALSHVNDYV